MKYVLFAAIAIILATVVTAYAQQVKCYAVCQQGNCTQVCIR